MKTIASIAMSLALAASTFAGPATYEKTSKNTIIPAPPEALCFGPLQKIQKISLDFRRYFDG